MDNCHLFLNRNILVENLTSQYPLPFKPGGLKLFTFFFASPLQEHQAILLWVFQTFNVILTTTQNLMHKWSSWREVY